MELLKWYSHHPILLIVKLSHLQATAGTTNAAIALTASAGGITATCDDTKSIVLTNEAADTYIKLNANTDAASETIEIRNAGGSTDGSDAAGAILFNAESGGIGLAWADDKDLWCEGGRAIVTANENAAEAIKLHADEGELQTIVLVNDAGTDEAAIALTASAGEKVDAAADKDIAISGGQLTLSSKENAASAISLTTNNGIAETIVVTNSQGTGDAAISLTASAGGMDLTSAKAMDITTSANNSNITINPHGTGTLALGSASNTLVSMDALAITLTSVNACTLTDGTASFTMDGAGATSLDAATTINLDCTSAMSLNSESVINIGNDDVDQSH